MSLSDTTCARTAGPATTPPVSVRRINQQRAVSELKYFQIPAAQHSVAEVPAVTPRPTAEVSNTRPSVPVLLAPRESPGQEEPVRGLTPAPAPGLGLASEQQAPAQARPALCVTRTLVAERRSAMKVWTAPATRDQSAPVRKFSNS